MRLRLQELQKSNPEAQELQLKKGYKEVEGVLHYQGLSLISKTIQTELISRHDNDLFAGHFGIKKTCKLWARKYFWPPLRHNVKAYVKGCDVCLALKAMRYKPNGDLESLPVPIQLWKDLSMNFMTGLPILTNWKGDSYDSILVIVGRLIKIVHYKPVKITINAPGLVKVIIDMIVCHHGLPDSIVTTGGSLFTSKFWLSLCYFLAIKHQISTLFHPQTDGQTERQNSTIKA